MATLECAGANLNHGVGAAVVDDGVGYAGLGDAHVQTGVERHVGRVPVAVEEDALLDAGNASLSPSHTGSQHSSYSQ